MLKPSYKVRGKSAIWSRLGKEQEFTLIVYADGEVTLDEMTFNEDSGAYFDRPTIKGPKAIDFAKEHIGADFMQIALAYINQE